MELRRVLPVEVFFLDEAPRRGVVELARLVLFLRDVALMRGICFLLLPSLLRVLIRAMVPPHVRTPRRDWSHEQWTGD